ncbi:hypothetical protein [Paenibacillus sp. GbtcB18]|uniref:hypothetical protein n=1 Tax=Paenibacillus sp. GbtcB18 TaxID=2824763 RepID=UPI001C30E7EF|nr:hypothetical protein [Paenibacillus sp. GbtcB18]
MNIKKALDKYVGPKLAVYGFDYAGRRDNLSWMYTREINKVTQYIVFFKSRYVPNGLRLELYTSLKITDVTYGHQLMEDNLILGDFWSFQDDDSLKEVLEEFVSLTIEKGIHLLELKSIPILQPTLEQAKELLENHELWFSKFYLKKKFSLDPSTLKEVEDLILAEKMKQVELDWNFIFEVSAYVGEVYKKASMGVWDWNKYFDTVTILDSQGEPLANPLNEVLRFWSNPEMKSYGLLEDFQFSYQLYMKEND